MATDREQFEKWANWDDQLEPECGQAYLYGYRREFSEDMDRYYNIYWQIAWEAWKAGRSAANGN